VVVFCVQNSLSPPGRCPLLFSSAQETRSCVVLQVSVCTLLLRRIDPEELPPSAVRPHLSFLTGRVLFSPSSVVVFLFLRKSPPSPFSSAHRAPFFYPPVENTGRLPPSLKWNGNPLENSLFSPLKRMQRPLLPLSFLVLAPLLPVCDTWHPPPPASSHVPFFFAARAVSFSFFSVTYREFFPDSFLGSVYFSVDRPSRFPFETNRPSLFSSL